MRKADVIIPTFKPGISMKNFCGRLLEQSVPGGPCDHHEYGRKVLGC